jgi:hypothetical protein
MKTCSRCKTEKDDAEFHNGACYCKPCAKIISHENYERNKEKILAQQKVYKQTDGKEMQASANKKYQQTEKGKESVKRGVTKYRNTPHGRLATRVADRNRRYEKKCRQDPNYESPFVDVEDLVDDDEW